jgi:hypothetical protein
VPGAARSKGIDTDGIFLDSVTARDQPDDAADIAADVVDFVCGKAILDVAADELVVSQVYDLKIIRIIGFEIMLGAWSGTVEPILQLTGDLHTDEQPLAYFQFRISFSAESLS